MASTLEEQLWAANAEVTRLRDAIAARELADLQARVDRVVADQERSPDAHALVEFIDELVPASTDPTLGVIATVICAYMVARDELVKA